MKKPITRTPFTRFQIPPDFYLVDLHAECALPYAEPKPNQTRMQYCPCCQRNKNDERLPLCLDTHKLLKMGQEVPMFFSLAKSIIALLALLCFVLVGEFAFSNNTTTIVITFQIPSVGTWDCPIGFLNYDSLASFIKFMCFALLIVIVKIVLKKQKYELQIANTGVSTRSLQVKNVPLKASQNDLRILFGAFQVESVIFTYKTLDHYECLKRVCRIRKQLQLAIRKRKSSEEIQHLQRRIQQQELLFNQLQKCMFSNKNRLETAIVSFSSQQQAEQAYKWFHVGFVKRVICTVLPSRSKSALFQQHMTVKWAPDPEDIRWECLETDYVTVKLHRFACYFMCFAILIFGVGLSYSLGTQDTENNLIQGIINTTVVIVINFFIISLLEYTTTNIEDHETNTNLQYSLMKKLTFFLFLNLSMSPLFLFIYQQSSSSDALSKHLNKLCISILLICLSNILKPLALYFSPTLILKFLSYHYQRYKGHNCTLTQMEANHNYEPMPFPIVIYYSLMLSSLFMTSFFMSVFQTLVVFQLMACCLLYMVAKYMLLRICKQPLGLAKRMSTLSQYLLSFCLYNYWLGKKIMNYFLGQIIKQITFWQYLAQWDVFTILQVVVLIYFVFFQQKTTAIFARKLSRHSERISDSCCQLLNDNANRMGYREVNNNRILLQDITAYALGRNKQKKNHQIYTDNVVFIPVPGMQGTPQPCQK